MAGSAKLKRHQAQRLLMGFIGSFVVLLAALPFPAWSDAAPPNPAIDEVVVSATRASARPLDLPVSIDSVGGSALHDNKLQISLAEALPTIPGILVQNRQNYAQDLQISSRGFGARATFGVTGLRIYVDGIPATQPDGQGQTSNIDIGSAARIEVLRGPFSALYGNSAGGVISVFTEDGAPGTSLDERVEFGSFDTSRFATKASGEQAGLNYVIDAVDFHTRGYRAHSDANRANYNGKLRFDVDADSTLTLIANAVDVGAQDPMGLTRQQFQQNPTQSGAGATSFNTRKSVDQQQAGLNYLRHLSGEDTLSIVAYGGNRDVVQFQSIPVSTEISPNSPGGVIRLAEGYEGTDIHWTSKGSLLGWPLQVTTGISVDALDEARRGYQNFVGNQIGIQGALRRNESDVVYDFDQYVQGEWLPMTDWIIEAGLRHSNVNLDSTDHYIVPGNGNDSGSTSYDAVRPVAGVTYKVLPEISIYASYGEGFETPTLDEISYRSVTGNVTGLNLGLKPSESQNYEIGLKTAPLAGIKAEIAGFHTETTNELAIAASSNGRSVYENIGRTNRDGLETSLVGDWDNGIGFVAANTLLRATYAQPFTSCPGLPCVPSLIPAGNRLPGVPLDAFYTELSWSHKPSGFSAGLEGRAQSKIYVSDRNSDAASSYLAINIRAGLEQALGNWNFREFARVENLADRKYAGSVIVNDSNGRYFEPAPSRAAYVGGDVRLHW